MFYFIALNFSYASNTRNNRIELVGTITGKYALAILRIDNQTEGIYQLKQNILGYRIDTITNTSVVLSKNSQSHTITLVAIKKRRYYGTTERSKKKSAIPLYEYRIHRNTFLSLQQDKQSWLNNVYFKVVLEQDYLAGYQLTYIRENSPAALLGLSEGDIITGINNVSIRYNNADFIKIIGQLEQVRDFTLNMRHSNTEFNVKFIIDDRN